MDRMQRILAFILALVLLISIIPIDMTAEVAAISSEAADSGQTDQNQDQSNQDQADQNQADQNQDQTTGEEQISIINEEDAQDVQPSVITVLADDARIHRSTKGTKAPALESGEYKIETVRSNMTYDFDNANRKVKPCLYNLRDLMTKPIGSSTDKGIDRYPYVVIKVNVKTTGYYDLGVKMNMSDASAVDTAAIIVDGIMHIVRLQKGTYEKQTVVAEDVYLTQGEHDILYMSVIPENEDDHTGAHNVSYPWANFWAFTFEEGLEVLDASSLTGTDVENIMKESTRIEAEDTRFVTWNIYSKTETNNSASGKTVVGGPAYAQCKQTFADLTANGLDKAKTPYLQYTVEAPSAGTYYLTVGAYVGTSTNNSNPVPYVAVIANDNAPVKAQFDGAWNKLDSVTVAVQLKQGTNIIRCTSVTPDQYSTGTAWVNQDYIEVQKGLTVKRTKVDAVHSDNGTYLYLSRDQDTGDKFADPGPGNTDRPDLHWDYPSLYEAMTGIYTKKGDGNTRWPYVAFQVNAPKAGEYQISAKIGTDASAKTIGMIVDGATHVVDVTTTSGWLTETVYLSQGTHIIIFTSPIPRDMGLVPSQNNALYPWMDYYAFELDGGLNFIEAPTFEEIQASMENYSRIEAEDFSYASANGNYNETVSKDHSRRSGTYTVKVKGAAGAVIDGTVTDAEKLANTQDSYVQYVVNAAEAGIYTIRVGAYLEGSGTMPYGTILVNGTAYKAQFSGNWNGYDAVNLPVQLQSGKNVIQCIGVSADQTGANGWIGYDFIDLPSGVTPEGGRKSVSATDSDCTDYLYLNRYTDSGSNFGGPDYADMRYDYPSLYEEMLGVYSNVDPARAGYWPYIAFRVNVDEAGYYRIVAGIQRNTAVSLAMIVDGATYAVDVTSNEVSKSVYLTKGEHIVIFTAPMPRDMVLAPKQDNALYPWMNYVSFKVDAGLSFGSKPTAADIQNVMANYIRVEAEDATYATANGKYTEETSKTYTRRYGQYVAKVKGQAGTADHSDYVEYKIYANEAGTYVIRIGAYLEGSGTMPYGTILVNGTAYKAQFSGNWNGYDAVNLAVSLNAGENTVRCIGVTADQTGTNGWIGYDFMDIPTGLRYGDTGEYTQTAVNKGFTFEKRMTYETDGAISQEPYTISAWVYVPSGYMNRGGVIFGNYVDGETPCTNFEIGTNGTPVFYHINGAGKAVSLSFNKASVCADVWTNVTFTISGNDVSCYQNGVLVQTLTAANDIDLEAVKNQYLLGGDLRPTTTAGSPNSLYFKCRILDVALFDKALSAEEVANVYKNAEANETKPFTRYKLATAQIGNDVADEKGNNDLLVKIPYFDKAPVTDYAYSFAVVGDTQIVAENDVIKGENNLAKIYDWILANKDSKNIQYVFGLGDITDNNTPAEWALAKEQMEKMDAAGLAYSVIRGNHDLVGYNDSTKTDYMTQYLGTAAYKSQFATGGFYDENISNSWRTFKVGNVDYLMLAMDFGPTDDVLAWAGEIIADHPDHSVIITTHAYLYRDGTTLDAKDTAPPSNYTKYGAQNNGDEIWEKLVSKYENIVLVLSGHDPSDNIIVSRDKGDNGNMVTSMLIDPQGVDSDDGSTGMLAMLYFSEDGTQIQVEYLSTVRAAEGKSAYFKEVNQFTVELFNEEVSASDKNWEKYLYLNRYADNGALFGGPNYSDMRWDYPSLYETMTGIYTKAADGTMRWPYIAFQVNAAQAGEYQISAKIGTDRNAKTIGMIVDGATHIVDVTTKSGWLEETVYLSEGTHIIVFTSPIPRDIEIAKGYVKEDKTRYTWMDFYAFEVDKGLNFLEAPTLEAIQASMQKYSRIEAEDFSYVSASGNYATDISKEYDRRSNKTVKVKGAAGAAIDGTVTDAEKLANTQDSYVQYIVNAAEAGTYTIRVGAYLEGSGTMPYGTILVNGKDYKAQFSGSWNSYDAVNLTVQLQKGENTIQLIGVSADQTGTNGWIGYDFVDLPSGVKPEGGRKSVSATDSDCTDYLYLNRYTDSGSNFGGPDYADMRYDYPSLYEEMLGIYSDVKPDRAGYWPYIALRVNADEAGYYRIAATVETQAAKTLGMIVDGAVYALDVTSNEVLESVYLTKGEHIVIFTAPIPRDMEIAFEKNDALYPWLNYVNFKLDAGLSFGSKPTAADIQAAMKTYTRIEAEDILYYVTYNANYGTYVTKKYGSRYDNDLTVIMGAAGAAVDGKVTAEEKKANTSQTFAQLSQGLDATVTSYVEYPVKAEKAGTYMIRVGAYVEGSGTMPYGTILVNGTAYKVQFTGNWNGYDAVNIPVKLQKGTNIIRCIGVTADQTDSNAWIGYDYLELPSGVTAIESGATLIHAGDESHVTFNNFKDQGNTLASGFYNDLRWDRLSIDILNYAYLERIPYAAIKVTAEKTGNYDIYFKSNFSTSAASQQIGILVDGVTSYSMTLDEFRSHASIKLTKGTHTIVFTTPMPATESAAAATAKFDTKAYSWMDMEAIILGKGLKVEKAPYEASVEKPNVTIEAEEFAMPNLVKITDTGVGSGVYLKAQTTEQILKDGIDPTVTPYVEYRIDASEAGTYTFYVALKSGTSAAMTASRMRCSFVIENGNTRQVKSVYSHKDTQGVVRVIPVTLNLKKGINVVRITHFTGDSVLDKGYVWNDFDYIQMSPAAAEKLTFLPTMVLEAEKASYTSYSEKTAKGYSGDGYLGSADYGYIDQNQITFEALDVENLGDLPRVTYLFEAEKAGTYTLSVKFNTGLINYKPEELDKIGFAVIVNGKDKQLVEFSIATTGASTTRTIAVDLVEGENEITFTTTLADYMRAVSPRIEDQYRLVWIDHDALYLSYGLSTGREAEKFGIEDSSVGRGQLKLLGLTEDTDDALDTDGVNGIIGTVSIIIGAAALVLLVIFIIILVKKKKKEEDEQAG